MCALKVYIHKINCEIVFKCPPTMTARVYFSSTKYNFVALRMKL